jgi:hypothetical protein
MKTQTKTRRTLLRSALIVAYVAIAVVLFIFNRGHTILVDNKADPAGSYAAFELMKVSMDGGKGMEFFRGDRDKFTVVGQRHRIRIEFPDGTPAFEGAFSVPLGGDLFLLSVPKMVAGIEPFIEPFVVARSLLPSEEDALPLAPDVPEPILGPDGKPILATPADTAGK